MTYPIYQENEFVSMTETFWEMEDGVKLYTQIIVPKGKEKCPVAFMRTPYDAAHHGEPHNIEKYSHYSLIDGGFAVVSQHVRGTGDSEGVMEPHKQERADGLCSLEHIRKLPCYNGEIFLYGGSYCGCLFLSILDAVGDDVKGAALHVCSSDRRDRAYHNGCYDDLGQFEWWLDWVKWVEAEGSDRSKIRQRPYKDMAKRVTGRDVPQFTGTLVHDKEDDPFWKQFHFDYAPEKWRIPVLFTGGWYDFYLIGMVKMWSRMPEETKKKSAFVLGPWPHLTKLPKVQHYDHPDDADRPRDFATDWFHSVLEGREYKYAEKNKLTYYSLGDKGWRNSVLPKVDTGCRRLYFGENVLTDTPNAESSVTYAYDPEKEVTCFKHNDIYPAHEIGTAEGVTSFLSKPFTEKESFFGHHRWSMEVSSDCEDTAFFMRIYMVENGVAYNLTQVITSLSYLYPDYKPGEKVKIDLRTPLMAFTIRKGGQIRVDIASADGSHAPHANVKGHWAEVTRTKVAMNTLHLGDGFIELEKE